MTGVMLALSAPLAAGTDAGGEAVAEAPPAAARADYSGVWETARLELVVLPEVAGSMTPEAQARADLFRKRFDPAADDTAKVCMIKGMPWTMLSRARNYPVEIVQYPDRIFMTFELYDQFRQIRIGGPQMPEGYGPSPNGWSVAHWDGDDLVIETAGLTALNPLGVIQRGWDARITEHWHLRDDAEFGKVIQVDMTIEDPDVFASPAHARQVLKRSPEGVVPGGYNCSTALWDDRMEERKAELGIIE